MEAHTYSENRWNWIEMDFNDKASLIEKTSGYYADENWVEQVGDRKTNNLQMDTTYEGKEVLWGSLVYDHDLNHPDSDRIFHFYLTREFLLTDYLDFDVFEKVKTRTLMTKLELAQNSIEGFLIFINMILDNFLQKIDVFEMRINELLWKLEEKNSEELLSEIMACRHQLLVLKNLILPIKEIEMAMPEAYGEKINEVPLFKKMQHRVDRAFNLVNEYGKEIESMVDLESVKADVRGNEIMKTLTIVTVLFTPVMAWGALWGMNFTYMPELDFKYGYLFAGLLIILNTGAIYFFLWHRGWMGDLLNKKKQSKKK